ncbi:tripartite tricarboxylate transporter TctB family protein [Pseudonocardia nematodicida]|uniref:Tripartite tricarboxylate transporter TctB family protein n=1 Tax=Pseudonocardia nematodicida TaxID=1206997 RepID=A0ABV1K8V7_9PSEU
MSEAATVRPARERPARSDLVGTLVLAAVGAVATVMGIGYGVFDDGQVGPGFLPTVTGAFILLASLAEIARMYLAAPRVDTGGLLAAAESAEKAAAEVTTEERDVFGRTARQRGRAILLVFGTMLGALLLVQVIGLLLSLGVMVLAITLGVERKPLLISVLTTAGAVGAAYLIFIVGLGVPTPTGALGLI